MDEIREKWSFYQIDEISGEYRWHENNMTTRNSLGIFFLASIIGPYHEFCWRTVALIKAHVQEGDARRAEEILRTISPDRDNVAKSPRLARELFDLQNQMRGERQQAAIIRDYFRYEPRACLSEAFKNGQRLDLLRLTDLFALKGIGWLKRRVSRSVGGRDC